MFKGRYFTSKGDIVAVHEIDESYQGEMVVDAMYWGHPIVPINAGNLNVEIPKKFWAWNKKGDCIFYSSEGMKYENDLHEHNITRAVNPQSVEGTVEVVGCAACTKDKKEREEIMEKRKKESFNQVSANYSPLDMLEDTDKRVVALREHIQQFMEERKICIGVTAHFDIPRLDYDRLIGIGRLINAIRSNPHG